MADRVPISTFPGLASALVDEDMMILPAFAAYTVTRVFLQRNGNTSGDTISATVRDATAGGGSGITCDLGDGISTVTTTGSLAVSASEALYLRVTAADANSENLRGWVEIEGGIALTSLLTSKARVKEFLGISGSDDDGLFDNLIASVSSEIQARLNLQFVQTTATNEPVDSIGKNLIELRYRPIISFGSLAENLTALVEDTDYEATAHDQAAGVVARISAGYPVSWASGRRVVKVTYDHGYTSVPEAVQQAATELVAFDYFNSKPGGKRLGLTDKVLDSGGSSSYRTRSDLWADQQPRLAPFRRL